MTERLLHLLRQERLLITILAVALLIPVLDLVLPARLHLGAQMPPIFIFAFMGFGINVVTGYCGLLNLGVAAFMAIGSYAYAILTCDIYPFQVGFWPALVLAAIIGAGAGLLLGTPTLRLRGDYLAIVTLGFGEIVQDCLRNLDSITKGTQGINPLPAPVLFSYELSSQTPLSWYYLLLGLLVVAVVLLRNLEHSRIGRDWMSIREDELAARCMGIRPLRVKLGAFSLGAAFCAVAGALWASYLGSTGDPGNYDFQISMIALCIVILGGLGSVPGVLLGSVIMIGFDRILLDKLSILFQGAGSSSVFLTPGNWKFMLFGLALVLTMRFMPEGLAERFGNGRQAPLQEKR